MRPLLSFLCVVCAVIATGGTAPCQNKASYDVQEPPSFSRSTAAGLSDYGIPGWKISRTIGEAAVLPGGFFTFGTVNGVSSSGLDARCGITFGHPYAKTSYPLLCIDGRWGKPRDFFPASEDSVLIGGDSLALIYRQAGMYRLAILYTLADDGMTLAVSEQLTNMDSVDHAMGCGIVFDPALGLWGDGYLFLDGSAISRDTSLGASALSAQAIEIREREAPPLGMAVRLEFPGGTPNQLVAGNWADIMATDDPVFTPSPLPLLYDLDLKMAWEPAIAHAGASVGAAMALRQETPDFGSGVFLRWDQTDHLILDDGLLYPSTVMSSVLLSSTGSTPRPQGTLRLTGSGETVPQGSEIPIALGAAPRLYAPLPVTVNEIYESTIVPLSIVYREGPTVVDSLVRRVFIPATPVTDTGLVVTLDSVILSRPPLLQTVFEVERKSTGAKIVNLSSRNVFLYDNSLRVQNFQLAHDTSGRSKTDIVFVLDVTGSMTDEIDGVKSNIEEFADSLQAQGLSFRLGMVTFLDAIENVYGLTSDVAVFKEHVAVQYAHGGDDAPENSLDALYAASEMPFLDDAQRIVIWITDANYHEMDMFTPRTKQQVIARLMQTDITVYSIGDPQYQTDWYNPIVNPTGGSFYSIYGKFRDILLDIAAHQLSPRYLLSFEPSAAGAHALTLWIHYAGLGGSASTNASQSVHSGTASLQCYPNPFNPETTIRMRIPDNASASVTVFNLLGQEVRRFDRIAQPGIVSLLWDARDGRGHQVATGVYFVRLDILSSAGALLSREHSKLVYLK